MASKAEYMVIAREILDDYGLVETLEEAHGLDEEEAESDCDLIALKIRDALVKAYEAGRTDRGEEHNGFCCDASYGADYAKFLP